MSVDSTSLPQCGAQVFVDEGQQLNPPEFDELYQRIPIMFADAFDESCGDVIHH